MMPVKLANPGPGCGGGREQPGTRRDEEMARRSIEVPGLRHSAPIPQAAVVGNLLVSGGISPVDPQTGAVPDGTDEQAALAFANVMGPDVPRRGQPARAPHPAHRLAGQHAAPAGGHDGTRARVAAHPVTETFV